jgi:hypothetical protein
MAPQTRLLVRHFVRGYLASDLAGGERHSALSAALLISPGLFTIVLLAAKYVMTPFPVPGFSALAGFGDRLLIFGASMTLMALVAVVQWDRLSLDSRDAAVLGVLPIGQAQIMRAKWIATALFASVAALLLNGLPSLIYPIVSIARLETSWGLVVQLTLLQFAGGVISGVLGFVLVLTIRELLWAVLGASAFVRISATVQAALIVVGVLAFFLQPTQAVRAVRSGHPAVRWIPAAVLAGAFEELGGRRVADLPVGELPRRVASRAAAVLVEYHDALASVRGSAVRLASSGSALCLGLAALLLWNNRRRLEAPMLAARGTRASRAVARLAWRSVAPRPETRAGATFAYRTLLRSLPHRLRLAVGLAIGLAAGAVVIFQEPPRSVPAGDTTLAVLSLQGLLVACVALGVRAALRRSADARAAWVFGVGWTGERAPLESGVALACWVMLSLPVLLLTPLWASMLGADRAVEHAAVGVALALALAELIVLTLGTLALVDDAIPSDGARALPVLGVPMVTIGATVLAATERWSPATAIGVLVVLAAACRTARLLRRVEDQPGMPSAEPSVALGLND